MNVAKLTPASPELDQLVEAVLASGKYQHVLPHVVRTIGAQELAKYRNLKASIKATKNKLHQTAGAYQSGKQDYAQWSVALQQAAGDPTALHRICIEIMAHH